MFIIRWFFGSLILFFDWLFSPRAIKRETSVQSNVDQQTAQLKLYQFYACPFCVKVRRVMKRLSLNIETRDAKNNQAFRTELATQGGKIKVPCLKIEQTDGKVEWLYESSDIIDYLEKRFD